MPSKSNSLVDIIGGGPVGRVTSHSVFQALTLIDSYIVNEHLGREYQMLVIWWLEVESHPKIEDQILRRMSPIEFMRSEVPPTIGSSGIKRCETLTASMGPTVADVTVHVFWLLLNQVI